MAGLLKNPPGFPRKLAFDDPTFPKVPDKPIGSHSIRKFPATYARSNGCARDDVDVRGR